MSYSVGQKVRVKSELLPEYFHKDFISNLKYMSIMCGGVLTIREVVNNSKWHSNVYISEENDYVWSEEMLEVIEQDTDQFHGLCVHGISAEEMSDAFVSIDTSGKLVEEVINVVGSKALVMFSGGYDSVAVAIKVIESGKYDNVTLLYEKVTLFDDHEKLSYNLYEKLKVTAESKRVQLYFDKADLNFDWISLDNHYDWFGRDLCLMVHLTTLFSKGQYDSIYLGWNKSNVSVLEYSSKLLKYLEEHRRPENKLFFMEDLFLEEDEEIYDMTCKAGLTKKRAVELVLDNNLFAMCSAEGEVKSDSHWYNVSAKWKEVLEALIDLNLTSKELAKVMKNNSLSYVQDLWNKKNKKEK